MVREPCAEAHTGARSILFGEGMVLDEQHELQGAVNFTELSNEVKEFLLIFFNCNHDSLRLWISAAIIIFYILEDNENSDPRPTLGLRLLLGHMDSLDVSLELLSAAHWPVVPMEGRLHQWSHHASHCRFVPAAVALAVVLHAQPAPRQENS